MKLFYTQFVEEINEISRKGLSNYYVMFFVSVCMIPYFSKEIQAFYLRLEKEINSALKRENIETKAINIITKYEGLLFWLSIFPKNKIEALINELKSQWLTPYKKNC